MANATAFKSVAAGLGASKRLNVNDKYVFTKFDSFPQYTDNLGGAVAVVTDAAVNTLSFPDYSWQVRLEQAYAGTVPQARTTADGLLILIDSTSTDGWELNLGRVAYDNTITTINTKSKGAFTIGTGGSFFLRVQLDIDDVSAGDAIGVGFSVGAYPADGLLATYTDFFALEINAGDIFTRSRLNSGTSVSTDTTQNVVDNGQPVLEVRVGPTGDCLAFIDGVAPTTEIASFTFDNTDVVHAFVNVKSGNDDDLNVSVMEWESGFLSSRGLIAIADIFESPQAR